MMVEKRLEQKQSVDHMKRLPHAITQILTGRKEASSTPPHNLWVARHRDVGLNERSMEPLFETDGDETMMDHHKQERRPCYDKKVTNLTLRMAFVLVPTASFVLSVNIVFTCSCRDCVVPPTHAYQVLLLAPCVLHVNVFARLPGSIRPNTTKGAQAALWNRIACGITIPARSCSTTSALSGLALLRVSRAPLSSMICYSKSLFAARGSASSMRNYWMRLSLLSTCEGPTVVLASTSENQK